MTTEHQLHDILDRMKVDLIASSDGMYNLFIPKLRSLIDLRREVVKSKVVMERLTGDKSTNKAKDDELKKRSAAIAEKNREIDTLYGTVGEYFNQLLAKASGIANAHNSDTGIHHAKNVWLVVEALLDVEK